MSPNHIIAAIEDDGGDAERRPFVHFYPVNYAENSDASKRHALD